MKSKLTPKNHNRRYYLHSKVKDLFSMDSRSREISIPVGSEEKARENKYVMELCNSFGYNLQVSIV